MNKWTLLKTFIATRWLRKFATRKQLYAYQIRKLRKHWRYLKKHSSYFAPYERFEDVPLMNKQVMMDEFDRLNTVQGKKELLLKQALSNEQSREFNHTVDRISVGLSSGTSGHRGIFITTEKEQAIWAGTILAKLLPHNRLSGHQIAFFLRANNRLYETVQSRLIQFEYFDTFLNISEHVARLNDYQPSILIAPASVLVRLAQKIAEHQLVIQPMMVVSVAEVLEESDRAYLLEQFQVNVIHQVYQATEGLIACTCHLGNLHINEDLMFLEKRYIDERRFYPIITDFVRTSQPIIRYELNDILVESDESCPCGSVLTTIAKIEGRSDDIFVFKNIYDERVEVFPDFIRRCILFVPHIREYQVNQLAYDQIEIATETVTNEQKKAIKAEFIRLANELNFVAPMISFVPYSWDQTIKLKRINKKFKEEGV